MKHKKVIRGEEAILKMLHKAKELEDTTMLTRREICAQLNVKHQTFCGWNAKYQILPKKHASAGRPLGSKNSPKSVSFSTPIVKPQEDAVTVVLFQGTGRTVANTLNQFLTQQ